MRSFKFFIFISGKSFAGRKKVHIAVRTGQIRIKFHRKNCSFRDISRQNGSECPLTQNFNQINHSVDQNAFAIHDQNSSAFSGKITIFGAKFIHQKNNGDTVINLGRILRELNKGNLFFFFKDLFVVLKRRIGCFGINDHDLHGRFINDSYGLVSRERCEKLSL